MTSIIKENDFHLVLEIERDYHVTYFEHDYVKQIYIIKYN
jgi:hypothetical protein